MFGSGAKSCLLRRTNIFPQLDSGLHNQPHCHGYHIDCGWLALNAVTLVWSLRTLNRWSMYVHHGHNAMNILEIPFTLVLSAWCGSALPDLSDLEAATIPFSPALGTPRYTPNERPQHDLVNLPAPACYSHIPHAQGRTHAGLRSPGHTHWG